MDIHKNNVFFKLYRIFFTVNSAVCVIFLALCFFIPDKFGFLNHTLRVCDYDKSFAESLLSFWLWDILPMCIVFLVGLTIYIPVLSVFGSAFLGIILALDIYAYFSSYGVFFALTMAFIRICCCWLCIWYLSYISTASVRLYTKSGSFVSNLDYVFVMKYIVWFTVFSLASFVLDTAQCLMYRF